jgi:hypothetical protein
LSGAREVSRAGQRAYELFGELVEMSSVCLCGRTGRSRQNSPIPQLFAFCYRPPKQKRPLDLPRAPAPLRLVKNETDRIRPGAVGEGGLRARKLASREAPRSLPGVAGSGAASSLWFGARRSSQSLTNRFVHVARFYASHLLCETIGAFRIRSPERPRIASPQHELIVLRRPPSPQSREAVV